MSDATAGPNVAPLQPDVAPAGEKNLPAFSTCDHNVYIIFSKIYFLHYYKNSNPNPSSNPNPNPSPNSYIKLYIVIGIL